MVRGVTFSFLCNYSRNTGLIEKVSPCRLEAGEVEIIVLVEGIEPTTSYSVQARHSYCVEDIVWDHAFAPSIFPADGRGRRQARCDNALLLLLFFCFIFFAFYVFTSACCSYSRRPVLGLISRSSTTWSLWSLRTTHQPQHRQNLRRQRLLVQSRRTNLR
eukprot:SAG31_NODE_2844_length_5009_cov_2.067006_5_plen_160_part_00